MNLYVLRDITSTIIWLGFFAAIFFAYIYYLRFRNKERMLLIEKNADIAEIYKRPARSFHFPWFILGFALLGIGVGLLSGTVVCLVAKIHEQAIVASIIFSTSLLNGALGIIIGANVEKKRKHG